MSRSSLAPDPVLADGPSILRSIPNVLTTFRILLLPVFGWLFLRCGHVVAAEEAGARWEPLWRGGWRDPGGLERLGAFSTLALIALSDVVDGWLARRFRWTSHLGAVLDPLADKLAQVTGLVLLTWWARPAFPTIPWLLLACILARDLVLLTGSLVLGRRGRLVIQPSLAGKGATLATFTLLLLAVAGGPQGVVRGLAWVSIVLVAASAAFYVRDGVRLARAQGNAAGPGG